MRGFLSETRNEQGHVMATSVGNENLRDLWNELSTSRGDHLFLISQDRFGAERRFTYREFDRLINRTANYFLSLGIRPGENVAIQLYNSPEYVAVTFALAKIGAVAVPLNMQHKLEETVFMLEKCAIRTVVAEPDCQCCYCADAPRPADACAGSCEGVRPYAMDHVLIAHRGRVPLYGAAVDFDAEVAACADELAEERPLHGLDTAMIIFTSGTTSCPKGVELTHANMLFAGQFGQWQCDLTPDDRLLTTMPAFHSNFQTAALMPVVAVGATLIVLEKYSARRYWAQVRALGVTALQLVAMMARTMMMQPCDPAERDHSVRSVQYYLAISDEERVAFEERFALRLQNCYGSTESVCWVLTDGAHGERRWPSVGRPGPGYEVEVRAEDGRVAAPGEVGDIAVRGVPGLSLMKGYYRDEAATAAALTDDGWYFPGDKGVCDEDGWFYFVDRKSNMIKRAGENISACEVEEVLADHPAVAEAAVIGVPDPVRDMAVKAFVVLREDAPATIEEITAYCACRLADFKVPTLMEVVDNLPHTSVGKVEKKRLASAAARPVQRRMS